MSLKALSPIWLIWLSDTIINWDRPVGEVTQPASKAAASGASR
jgi:hypothetical protein